MKRIMFWTLVFIIPSFVAFYGWQRSSRGRGRGGGNYQREAIAFIRDAWFGLRERGTSPLDEHMAQRTLEQEYRYLFQSRRLTLTPEEIRNLIGPRELAYEAIHAYYLQRLAREKGLEVTDEEIRAYLENLLGGRPVEELRKNLWQQGLSEDEFLYLLKYQETLDKARNHVYARAKASLFELWQEYLIGQEKIQIRFVKIPIQDFLTQVKPTTDSLRSYYQENSEKYRVGDRAEFRYVAVFRSEVEKEVQTTSEAVVAFYEKNKEKLFSRKRSTTIRHILLRVPSDAPTSVVLGAELKIRDLAAKIKAGAGFAEMANTYSEDSDNVPDPKDPTKKRGGLIPAPIPEDAPCVFGDEFKRVALSLAADQVSSPVKTAQGFHLIKADKVTTAGIIAFAEVKDQAQQLLHEQLTDAEFRKRGEELKALFSGRSYSTLASFAEAAKQPVAQSGLIDLEEAYIPKIGSIGENLDLIKDMQPDELLEAVFKSPEAHYVLELQRKDPTHVPPFEEVTKKVQEDYETSFATTLAHQAASAMVSQAKNLEELQKQAEKRGYQLKQSEMFTRDKAAGVLDLPALDPQFSQMTLGYKVGTTHLTTQGNPKRPVAYIVWYFENRQKPTLEQFSKDLPSIRAQYLAAIQEGLLEEWFNDMTRRYPARVNPTYLPKEEKKGQESKEQQSDDG